ncbi:MAG: hypothetical protein E4H36_03120 [Spirochaetales bacterium]|nr:MAG: hypothetical protein E4H36_03120 [Spirochaetales bacterium]
MSRAAAGKLGSDKLLQRSLVRGCRMEVCVIGVWLGGWTSQASESLVPEAVLAQAKEAADRVRDSLSKIPAFVTKEDYPYIQAVIPRVFSDPGTGLVSVRAAEEIVQNMKALSGNPGVRIGITQGSCAAGIRGRDGPFIFIGRPPALCRLFAAERNRFGYTVLLDEETGREALTGRPVDYYRTPGFTGIKTLYGSLPRPEKEYPGRFDEIYQSALKALHIENDTGRASDFFTECLGLVPADEASSYFLERIGRGQVTMRAYRDLP